ncbi:MAG: hypothetical protein CL610_26675 [Anaerolineaceae bacterium]|nr:hypothetical protein [Anaerolineaceae bacterium]
MNHASQWRIDIALDIAPHYARYAHVEAVVVLGGVARGWADAYSDIDLVVYWRQPPTEAERSSVSAALGAHPGPFGDTFTSQPDPTLRYWWEEYYLGGDAQAGLKIDVGHHLSADMDAVVEAVTQHHDPHALKHEMLYSIKRVQTFYGDARINRWKQAAGMCPQPLAQRIVEENLNLPPFWMARASADRDDGLLYARVLQEVCQRLLMVIVALNREYFPGVKRQAQLLAEMRIQPVSFHERINQALRANPDEAIPAVEQLYDEVFALARQHMPQADIAAAPQRFHFQRPRLSAPLSRLP